LAVNPVVLSQRKAKPGAQRSAGERLWLGRGQNLYEYRPEKEMVNWDIQPGSCRGAAQGKRGSFTTEILEAHLSQLRHRM